MRMYTSTLRIHPRVSGGPGAGPRRGVGQGPTILILIFKESEMLKVVGLFGVGLAVMGCAFSLPFRVRFERVAFGGLPSCLRGMKILHITDLHGRRPDRMHRDIWPNLLDLDFDMAVLTGDVILDDVRQLRPYMDSLKFLAEKAPVFYVEGNHEQGYHVEMARILESIGVTVLYNRRGNFAVGNAGRARSAMVSVAGFRDYDHLLEHDFDGVRPMLDDMAKSGKFHIVLSHQPQIFDLLGNYVRKYKPGRSFSALVLAGHTHGGQVRLPFMPTLYAPGQGVLPKYGDGWYYNGGLKLFVSRGVGATHFPLRVFNPPEAALIELE